MSAPTWISLHDDEVLSIAAPHYKPADEVAFVAGVRAVMGVAMPGYVAQGWMPIATAPKDGTLIMLGRAADEENDRGEISTPGRWHDEDHDGPDNMGHDAGFMDDEFQQFSWGRSFGAPSYMSKGFQPTHWQPLPAAPGTQAAPVEQDALREQLVTALKELYEAQDSCVDLTPEVLQKARKALVAAGAK